MPRERTAVVTAEEQLIRDALGDVPVSLISREPLGAGSVAGFTVEGADPAQVYYVDTSGITVDAETGMATGEDPAHPEARVWMHPADPHLPALAPVAYAHAAEVLLDRLGIRATGPGDLIAYRPGRRAVVRIPAGEGTVWVKVVRPRRVRRIVDAHAACASAGLPVPPVRGWSPEGLVVLAEAEGLPAPIADWHPAGLIDAVDRLRPRIAAVRTSRRLTPVTDRLDWYATHSQGSADAMALVERIRAGLATLEPTAPVVVHGDLHFGQLFLSGDTITGLIDVDTLGIGAAAEDPAAFVAHALASAEQSPAEGRSRLRYLAGEALDRWGADPAVRIYAATHLLGHAIAARDLGDPQREDAMLAGADRLLRQMNASNTRLRTVSRALSIALSPGGDDGGRTSALADREEEWT
ncbi:phosphotransferase [Microbacterium sp. CIAB417]|uniref:phosphotransferase n=1 Tax=Microbacterium sp. CIAB417 TaxID=2860287 RepID=UPI0024C08F51|nr:phosphotransferase [Microbacterium sp. CIAB417]